MLALSIGGLGAYYETNDDLIITQLLRGVTAAAPVTDLHLYFHGFARYWLPYMRSFRQCRGMVCRFTLCSTRLWFCFSQCLTGFWLLA
ncbi:hypothetical protein H9L05_19075 [Hymenobacter qilianensis]|uniref:Uncharacterized protein n=1 Tax=Hymenobacter qilianensis TaxID=1385715 RepID=A0A7H0GUL7_9BACT|nr:hypothetical protein [Hymenobacter qilianensis]QNP51983.1 hypothetical protein H9L05_19075 [Hymenobacter qilianensis]